MIDGNINDTTTDAQGKFTTHALPIGNYQVQFSKNGYSKTVTIEVVDEGDTAHNVEFTAEAVA